MAAHVVAISPVAAQVFVVEKRGLHRLASVVNALGPRPVCLEEQVTAHAAAHFKQHRVVGRTAVRLPHRDGARAVIRAESARDLTRLGVECRGVDIGGAEEMRALVADVAEAEDRAEADFAFERQVPLLIRWQLEATLEARGREVRVTSCRRIRRVERERGPAALDRLRLAERACKRRIDGDCLKQILAEVARIEYAVTAAQDRATRAINLPCETNSRAEVAAQRLEQTPFLQPCVRVTQ